MANSWKKTFQSCAKVDLYTSFDFEFHTVSVVFIQLFSDDVWQRACYILQPRQKSLIKLVKTRTPWLSWNVITFQLCFITVMLLLPNLTSHLSPVQDGRHEHENVCFSLSGKQEPPLKQLVSKHPWLIKEIRKVKKYKIKWKPWKIFWEAWNSKPKDVTTFSRLHKLDSTFRRNSLFGEKLKVHATFVVD